MAGGAQQNLAQWKRVRQQALRRARRDGLTNCPECGVTLDYNVSGLRNSAEVDHITPSSQGGKDKLSNTQTICRRCNQSLGAKLPPKPKGKRHVAVEVLPTSQEW